jgi:hypothetical protein
MRLFGLGAALIATACLAACDRAAPQPGPGGYHGGRYLGIGTYPAGRMWSHMVASSPAAATDAARLGDDEQVIVTVDSHTGEVRQCGNLTGYCIGMNPWTGGLGAGQVAPIPVSEHVADQASGPAAAQPAAANIAAPVRTGGR